MFLLQKLLPQQRQQQLDDGDEDDVGPGNFVDVDDDIDDALHKLPLVCQTL